MSIADEAKDFYRSTTFAPRYTLIRAKLIDRIIKSGARSVLEFGCHDGVNLELIKQATQEIETAGIDINPDAITRCNSKGHTCHLGDEKKLKDIPDKSYDLVFTNSVLCHMPDVSKVIEDFKRIARKKIILCETNEVKGRFYFPHEYSANGFNRIDYLQSIPQPFGNGAWYGIYEMEL